MVSIETITAKLTAQPLSFAELLPEEQAFLAEQLRPPPGGFTPEQRALFAQWVLVVPDEDLELIEVVNSDRPFKISSQQLTDQTHVLGVDLLTDIRSGETYSNAAQWLVTLKFRAVTPLDFPASDLPP